MTLTNLQAGFNPLGLIDDSSKPTEGFTCIRYRDNGGAWQTHYERLNRIVKGARKVLAHAIGDRSSNSFITALTLGGSNLLPATELLSPRRPEADDRQMVYTDNMFVRNSTDRLDGQAMFRVNYPDSPNETSVLFEALIGKSEANFRDPEPTVYVCAGLLAGDILFASQSFPVLTKVPNREFLIQWEVRF